jgi:hypothetical protein
VRRRPRGRKFKENGLTMPFGLLHINPLREVNIYKLTLSNGQLSYLSMIVISHHLLAQD